MLNTAPSTPRTTASFMAMTTKLPIRIRPRSNNKSDLLRNRPFYVMRPFIRFVKGWFLLYRCSRARIKARGGRAFSSDATELLHNFLSVARSIVAREPSQSLGQDFVMVHVLEPWLFCNVQPQTVQQENILRLHG